MHKRITTIPTLLAITTGMLFGYACTKYDMRLDAQNKESGIVEVVRNGQQIGEAQIDETITVYAKIGEAGADIKMFVSGAEATILSRGHSTVRVKPATGQEGMVGQDTFNIVVPRAARIGAGTVYFSIDGVVKPALPFTVKRPDILIPNKVFVEPFYFAYSDSTRIDGRWEYTFPKTLRDGAQGTAYVNMILQLTYDQNTQTFYFVDQDETTKELVIRQLKGGTVTTIAGGGKDYQATTAKALRIGAEEWNYTSTTNIDMETGPDGKLYFTNFYNITDESTGIRTSYSLIQSVDPLTGKIETLAGNNGRMVDYFGASYAPTYRGLEDGDKTKAMIQSPRGLSFDKNGDLCFIDWGVLLRRLKKDGSIETVLGKVNRDTYDYEDENGKTHVGIYYSTIDEHSDGFGDEVRFYNAYNMVKAGSGKLYILSAGAGWNTNIVEVNLDTKEASTIVGQPEGSRTGITTGTFKEVEMPYTITTFDVDYEGNILMGFTSITKVDLKTETISRIVVPGDFSNGYPPQYTSQRHFMQHTQPGNAAILGRLNRITFDQFGNLFIGYDHVAASADIRIAKVVIEK